MLAVLLRTHEHYEGPVNEGNGVAFGGDICRSEGEDGKDSVQHVHDLEARWAEVVGGYCRKWWVLASSSKRCQGFIRLGHKDTYNRNAHES